MDQILLRIPVLDVWEDALDKAIMDNNVARTRKLLAQQPIYKMINSAMRKLRLRREINRNSLLHVAAFANSTDVARWLIEQGADVNCLNPVGITPLHIAAFQNSWETADLLISRGARLDIRDDRGRTPLDVAQECGNTRMVELLELVDKSGTSGA